MLNIAKLSRGVAHLLSLACKVELRGDWLNFNSTLMSILCSTKSPGSIAFIFHGRALALEISLSFFFLPLGLFSTMLLISLIKPLVGWYFLTRTLGTRVLTEDA